VAKGDAIDMSAIGEGLPGTLTSVEQFAARQMGGT
jgi:hypothetical protein